MYNLLLAKCGIHYGDWWFQKAAIFLFTQVEATSQVPVVSMNYALNKSLSECVQK